MSFENQTPMEEAFTKFALSYKEKATIQEATFNAGYIAGQKAGAAPELLEALELMLSVCGEDEASSGLSPEGQHQVQKAFQFANYAVSKAKGAK